MPDAILGGMDKANEGYGTEFPHPAAECQTCKGTGQVWTAELDGTGAWDQACPDCDTAYPWPLDDHETYGPVF